jgi:fucose permease
MPDHARSKHFTVLLCYAAMMCLAIAVNLMPVFLTTVSLDFGGAAGLTNEQLGRIGAATFAGLVLGILITGPLADRLGAKPFTLLGNALIAGGLLTLHFAESYLAVLVASFIMGFGAGVLDMVLSPIVCALEPERRAAAMNWLHSFYCTGAVATVLAAAWALKAGAAWRSIALWLTVLPALVCLSFAMRRIPPLVAEATERMPLRTLCRNRYFQVALLAIFLGGATELGMAQWLPAYAEKTLGYSKWTGGMALLGFSLAMAVGRIAVGMLGPRVNPLTLMIGCCWCSVALFVLGCFLPWPAPALAACILAGLTGSTLWPSMLGVAADRFPRGGASMFSALAALGNFGGIFMPWVVGVTTDYSSMRWGLATATLCPFLMALLLVWMKRHEANRQTTMTAKTPSAP